MANNEHDIKNFKLIDNQQVGISGTIFSQVINLEAFKAEGNITIQVEVTGSGVVSFQFDQSNNFNEDKKTGDFVRPVSGFVLVTGFTSSSGTGLNGKDLLNVPAFNSKFIRIRVAETGAAAVANVSVWVSVQ